MKTFLNILFVRLRFVFVFVAVALVIGNWERITNVVRQWMGPPARIVVRGDNEWFCPMHPAVVSDEKIKCPICGMDLSERKRGDKPVLSAGVLSSISLTPQRIRQGGIASIEVGYRPLVREIRTVGTLARDERRIWDISARVDGRIEKLLINTVGAVMKQGEPMLELYSPELMTTVAELRLSVQRELTPNAEAARKRLRLWGLAEAQIATLETSTEPAERFPIPAPYGGTVTAKYVHEGHTLHAGDKLYEIADLSRLWLEAHLFERDIALVKPGQAVHIAAEAHPGRHFDGHVTFVHPVVEAATRTVKVRVELDNADGALKPDMYVTAHLSVPIGRTAEVFWGC